MRGYRRLIVALGVVILALAGPALSSASSSAHSLAGIALQVRDLPRGFFVMVPHYETNAFVARQDHVSVAFLKREGRILGFLGQDARDSGRGIVFVQDDVVEYKSPHAALAEYRRGVAGDSRFRSSPGYHRYRRSNTGTALVSFQCLCGLDRQTVDVLDSHQGDYYFWIEVHANTGTISGRRVAHLTLHYGALVKDRIPQRLLPVPNPIPQPMAPDPGPTPTPQAIAQPPGQLASHPLNSITCYYTNLPGVIGQGLYDTQRGGKGCVEIRNWAGGNFSGELGPLGQPAPAGSMYLYPYVTEHQLGGSGTFASSFRNFEAKGSDGHIFYPHDAAPYQDQNSVLRTVSLQPGPEQSNNGFVMFAVPEHDGPYTILWNEAGTIPFTPLATLPVFPSH